VTPSTVERLTILVLLILPGTTYLFARERLLGIREPEQDATNRFLRALGVGITLDALYLTAAGPQLVALFRGPSPGPLAGLLEQPRAAGLALLLLLVVIPTLVARGEAFWIRRKRRARHDRTPTAWDGIFQDRGPCFVRARLRSGNWAGGWYGERSRASAYPQAGDLFLQSQYHLMPDGTFGDRVTGSAGLYLRASDIDVLEILECTPTNSGEINGPA
jgi:hypothetical protein